MQAVYDSHGNLIIVGEAKDNSNLLMFTVKPDGSVTVGDLTTGVHNANPNDKRVYQIQ